MQFRIGTMQVPAGPAPVSVPVTGLGFKPQAVRFYATGVDIAATIDPFAQLIVARGAMNDQGEQFAQCNLVYPGAIPTTNSSKRTSKCFVIHDGVTLLVDAQYVSMDADGFTVNFTTTDGVPRDISWQAFGDVRATKINEFEIPASARGTYFDDLNISWDLGMMHGCGSPSFGDNDGNPNAYLDEWIGSVADAGNKGITYGCCNASVTAGQCGSGSRQTFLRMILGTASTGQGTAAFAGPQLAAVFLSAITFTHVISVLAMVGIECRFILMNSPSSPSVLSYTLGFRPDGVIFFGSNRTAAPGIETITRAAQGFTDGVRHFSAYSYARRSTILGVLATRVYQLATDQYSYRAVPDLSGGAGADVAGLVTAFTDTGFTVDWQIASAATAVFALGFRSRNRALASDELLRVGLR